MPQIFDVIANENSRNKRNELECTIKDLSGLPMTTMTTSSKEVEGRDQQIPDTFFHDK